jgi:RecB family exonuclease
VIELEHLSYSSVSLFQACPRAWFYRYVEKLRVPASPALVMGSAFHATIEHILRAKVTGEVVDPTSTWAVEWQRVQEQEIAWNGDLPEALAADGARMITSPASLALLASLSPLIENGAPVIEKRIELRVPGVPIPVIGFIDFIGTDGTPGDFKTAARAWPADKAAKEDQATVYLAALNQAGYTLNPDRRFTHYVWTKGKAPKVETFTTTRTVGQMFGLMSNIKTIWDSIQAGLFPTNTTTWKCSPRFCDAWPVCQGKM